MARKWTVLAVTSLGVFMAFLDTTIVNIAFTDITRHFPRTSLSDLSWVLNGYTVLFAAALIPAGRIADRFGRRRVFLTGLLVFTAASALCGAAPTPALLIAARVVQGIGAAAMIPSALGLVLAEFPAAQRGTAIGLWSMAGAVAGAAGTPIGGVIVDVANWRWAFLVNVPVGLLAAVLGWRILVERREAAGTRVPDLLGAAALAGAVGALALGIVKGADWGWASASVLASFLGAALLGLAFILRSARHPAPVMELGLWRVRSFAVANVATLVYAMGFFAMFLASALFLTGVWRYSTIQAGLAIAPGPATAGIVGALAGRVADRWGQRVLLVPGQLLFAAGVLWIVVGADTTPGYLTLWLPAFLLTGVGVGLSLPALSGAAVAALPSSRLATGGAVNNTARQVGAVLGVAILIAIVGRPGATGALDAFRHGFIFCAACAAACSVIGLGLGGARLAAPAVAPAPVDATAA
jgi:EmrB/QacA subfamily drug resistance transporter